MKKRFRSVFFAILTAFCMAMLLAGCDLLPKVSYELYFRVDGDVYTTINTTGDEVVSIPEDPVKDGYTFEGWFWDNNVWEKPFTANSLLDAPISRNMSVYAKFVILHEHAPSQDWSYDAESHWKDCSCGEKFEYGAHHWTEWSVETPATEEEAGLEIRSCTVCGQREQRTVPRLPHTHAYMIENPSEQYLKTPANCYGGAVYYKSCACGEKGTETFTYGDPVHQYKDTVYQPTCDSDGYTYHECEICGDNYSDNHIDHLEHVAEYHGMKSPTCLEAGNSEYWSCSLCHKLFSNRECTENISGIPVLEATGHSYASDWDHDGNYHWKNAICEHAQEKGFMALHDYDETYTCKTCGYVDKGVHGTDVLPATLHKEGESLSLTVANAVTTYSLRNEFTVADGAVIVLSANVECTQPIVSMVVSLSEGDNVFYLLVTKGKDSGLYTITIRRRPMYTVSFDTDGGQPVPEQRVEEGVLAEEPSTEKTGYHFEGWDFNFATPVTGNVTVKAKWSANKNTKYTVEYYLENLEDSEFTLRESVICYGETDSTVQAEIRMYDHFTVRENNVQGTISPDGTAKLKVYYTRDVYTVTFAGNGGTRTGGGAESQQVKYLGSATPPEYTYHGYNFTGFNGSYTNISASVTLTAQWSEIAKQNYDMTGITFANESLTFDGNSHSIFIKGDLPDGVQVRYEGNGQIDAGTYTITAKFTGNSETHYPIQDMTAVLTIHKAAYNMDGIQFLDKDVTYDGSRHTIAIDGQLPTGVYVQYYCGGEVFVGKVDQGRYEVRAKFTGDETNHLPIPEMAATLTISLQKLDTPTITKVEYDTVYWKPVENADSYTVRVNDNYWLSGVRGTECGLDKVLERGDGAKIKDCGIVRIEVCADEYDSYGASEWSELNEDYYYVPRTSPDQDKAAAIEGYSIGEGFNLIEEEYLRTEAASGTSIFDVEKLLTISEGFASLPRSEARGTTYEYSTIDEYLSQNSVKAGVGVSIGFPMIGSLKVQVDTEAKYEYSSYTYNNVYVYEGKAYWNDYKFSNLRKELLIYCLSDQFLKALNREAESTAKMTDDELVDYLFNKYGTHAILGVTTGGIFTARYVESTNKSSTNLSNKASLTVEGKVSFDKIFDINPNFSIQEESNEAFDGTDTKKQFTVSYRGGSSGLVSKPASIDAALQNWSKTVGENPVSMEFTNDGTIALADLLAQINPTLAAKLEAYINERADAEYDALFAKFSKTPTLPLSMDTSNGINTLIVDLSKYQEPGSLKTATYPSFEDNVLTVYTTMFGREVDAIKVKGSYHTNHTLIDGFTIRLSSGWQKDVKIILENVGIRAANERGFIELVAGVKNYTIEYLGKNEIRGIDGTRTSQGSAALLLEGATVTIASQDASASLSIYGGNGANGVNSGENGTDGGVAIIAEKLTVHTAGNLSVYGGKGGNGVKGADSNVQGDTGWKREWVWQGKAGTGGKGGQGGKGGNGGNGGDSMVGTLHVESGTCLFSGGQGGNGGQGGKGGKGGTGGGNTAWFGNTGDGGKGGKGGTGGNAGKGGTNSSLKYTAESSANLKVQNGEYGKVGAGGEGGDPGKPGVPNEKCGGGGKTGEKGDTGEPGKLSV